MFLGGQVRSQIETPEVPSHLLSIHCALVPLVMGRGRRDVQKVVSCTEHSLWFLSWWVVSPAEHSLCLDSFLGVQRSEGCSKVVSPAEHSLCLDSFLGVQRSERCSESSLTGFTVTWFLAWWAERGEQPRKLRRLQHNQPLNDPKLTSGSLSRLGDPDTKVSLSLLWSACSRAARCLLAA